jgi:precorrin-6B methylase 2
MPMVDLLSGESDLALDGGCGAGRTTVALGRALKKGRIVALDRFDSDYIEGGGRALLERNLRARRARRARGDQARRLTHLPFPD